jgi:transcriptional regulator with XRE-family HTH domain
LYSKLRKGAILENIFGERLKLFRKFKNITQEKLAEMIDIDTRQIVRLESGESLPSLSTLLKLCEAFGITPNEFLLIKEKKEPLKSDINDMLKLANHEQLKLIKKIIRAIL